MILISIYYKLYGFVNRYIKKPTEPWENND